MVAKYSWSTVVAFIECLQFPDVEDQYSNLFLNLKSEYEITGSNTNSASGLRFS